LKVPFQHGSGSTPARGEQFDRPARRFLARTRCPRAFTENMTLVKIQKASYNRPTGWSKILALT
jgi:hypothetical protein